MQTKNQKLLRESAQRKLDRIDWEKQNLQNYRKLAQWSKVGSKIDTKRPPMNVQQQPDKQSERRSASVSNVSQKGSRNKDDVFINQI